MKKKINGFTKKEWKKYPELCNLLEGLFGDKHDRRVTMFLLNHLREAAEKSCDDNHIVLTTAMLDDILTELAQTQTDLIFTNRVKTIATSYQDFICSLPVGAKKVAFNEWELPEEKKTSGRTKTPVTAKKQTAAKKPAAKMTAPAKRSPGRPRKTDK